jgi:hypothetical protein
MQICKYANMTGERGKDAKMQRCNDENKKIKRSRVELI